jgi:hypothetical protein
MRLAIVHPKVLASQDFTPSVANEGIPGSEETLINVSKEFVRQGVAVTVYTQTATTLNFGRGLSWRPIEQISSREWYDCLCLWSDNPNNLLHCNDHLPGAAVSCVRLVNQSNEDVFRQILHGGQRVGLTQTDWFTRHSSCLGAFPLFRWNNGIHPHRYLHASCDSKIPGRIFWGSDYDRGLIHVLSNWPEIRARHPHVTLTVCYGWDVYDAKMASSPPHAQAYLLSFRNHINHLLQQEGISHLGRISHRRVDEELLSSEFWFYPCTFPENCSTLSLKAQAAKCVPVIIPTGGLSETVKYGLISSQSLWHGGRIDDQLVGPAVQEWLNLADQALKYGYASFDSIIDANLRRVKREYSYAGVVNQFIQRFF